MTPTYHFGRSEVSHRGGIVLGWVAIISGIAAIYFLGNAVSNRVNGFWDAEEAQPWFQIGGVALGICAASVVFLYLYAQRADHAEAARNLARNQEFRRDELTRVAPDARKAGITPAQYLKLESEKEMANITCQTAVRGFSGVKGSFDRNATFMWRPLSATKIHVFINETDQSCVYDVMTQQAYPDD